MRSCTARPRETSRAASRPRRRSTRRWRRRCSTVKGFDRSLEKTKEYADEKKLEGVERILAPLHVIDALRCSFVVRTIARNIELGEKLMARFPPARTKNGHQRDNRSYADRKCNLVAGPFGPDDVRLLCEVQILMERYIEIKQIGHLLYEFQR